jgi:glycerate 2-kinase
VKVLLAPDKFAGTLTAAEAAAAMAEGWRRARPGDEVVLAPLADGGEGTLEVVAAVVPGCERVHLEVADARGIATTASWLLLPDGRALVESAQACGLRRLAEDQRDPLRATTYGVGQLLLSAAAAGAREIVVGLGGSATVDGGAGMATALGHRLLRADGNGVKVGALWLDGLERIEPLPGLGVPVRAAVDVTAPLLGPSGAAAVFGPQKGAGPEDVPVLEAVLTRLADVAERDLPGGPWRDLPGAGAAGGLGFGLAAFCGAELIGGAELVAGLVGFHEALADAEVVVTGEGALDAQTATGKGPAYVLDAGRERDVPVLAVAGRLADGAGERFDAAVDLGPEGLLRAAALVADRTEQLARGFA